MSKYLDPPDGSEIIKNMSEFETIRDIKNLAEKVFPGWYVASSTDFSNDYSHLSRNWKKFCDMVNVNRTLIILVDYISFDDSHTVIRAFAECFTRAGFNVRSADEYILCSECNKVIPSKNIWSVLKEKGAQVPSEWSEKCSTCQ